MWSGKQLTARARAEVIFASPFRTQPQTKSEHQLNPYGFYLIDDEFLHRTDAEASTAMIDNARIWAAGLHEDFVANCANRGSPGPGRR